MRKIKIGSFFLIIILFCFVKKDSYAAVIQSGTCGDGVSYELDDQGILTISGSGEMNDYSSSMQPWFFDETEFPSQDNMDRITKVIINEGVTKVGSNAFENAVNLFEVNFPDTLDYIGAGAFSGCVSLKSIELPQLNNLIGGAFKGCSSLETVELPKSVTSIGNGLFENCTSLKTVVIKGDITSIGDSSFAGCVSLKNINFPDCTCNVGSFAFFNCTNLVDITIPDDYFLGSTASFGYIGEKTGTYYVDTNVIIHANPNTSAYNYAKSKGIKFSCITHTPETISGVEATETTTGLTEGSKCSVCGEILVTQEEIPKLTHTHTAVVIPAVDPTDKTTGLTEGLKCSECGEIIKAQEVIPKISFKTTLNPPDSPENKAYIVKGKKIPLKMNRIKNVNIISVKWRFEKKKYKKYATLSKKGNIGYIKIKKSANIKKIVLIADITYTYNYNKSSGLFSFFSTNSAKLHHASEKYTSIPINKKITSIRIKFKKTSVKLGKSVIMHYRLKPKNIKTSGVSWSSSRKDIATISYKGGLLTPRKKGRTTITCYCSNGVDKVLTDNMKIKIK